MPRFPNELGEVGGKTFEEVWVDCPKWTEFVRETWTNNCTGLFLEFQEFVTRKAKNERCLGEHVARCIQYCKNKPLGELPRYLLKYKDV